MVVDYAVDIALSLAMADLPSDCASKMAGRLPMITTVACDKIGHAQFNEIVARENAPIAPMIESETGFGMVV